MRRLLPSGVLLLLASSCGGAPPATPAEDAAVVSDAATSDAGPPPVDAARADTGVPTTTSTGSIGPFSVSRGMEQTLCVVVELDNAEPAMLRAIYTHLTPGSHHLIVSRADGLPLQGPAPCPAFASGVTNAIFIAQNAEASLVYPDDAGLPINAHQRIGIEMHMINYFSDAPIDIAGSVDFELAARDAPLREVHILFTGTLALSLPPHQESTVETDFAIPDGTEVFALTSHTHSLGTYTSLHIVGSASDPGELVHESRSWADPPLDVFAPPRVFGPRQSLRLTCTYFNDTDDTVTFGEDFDREMCFLWAYYLDPA
jgi:hypothetical protein